MRDITVEIKHLLNVFFDESASWRGLQASCIRRFSLARADIFPSREISLHHSIIVVMR